MRSKCSSIAMRARRASSLLSALRSCAESRRCDRGVEDSDTRGDEGRGDEGRGDEGRGDEGRGDEARGDEARGVAIIYLPAASVHFWVQTCASVIIVQLREAETTDQP